MKTKKRIISVVLVFCMLVTLFPGGTLATPDEESVTASPPFTDVPDTHWAHAYVQQAHARELVRGNPDGTFNLYGRFTRAEAATVLWRVADSPVPEDAVQFYDVAPGAWYAVPVAWAAEQGIILGRGNNLFAPGEAVTRQEFVVLLERLARWMDVATATPPMGGWRIFPDHDLIDDWARDAVLWLTGAGIVRGDLDGRLNPNEATTRAEAAALVMRFYERLTSLLICPGCGDERVMFIPSPGAEFEDNSVQVALSRCVSIGDREWTVADFGGIGALYVEELTWPWAPNEHDVRIMRIRLDQNCKENVRHVMYQLYQQHKFILAVGVMYVVVPD